MNTFFLDQFAKTSALLLVAMVLVPIVAREATAAEIANIGVSIEVQLAELTVEQLVKLPAFNSISKALDLERVDKPSGAPDSAFFIGGGKAYIAALKAAGIPIASPAAVKAPENKRTTIRARKLVRPDGITEFTDVLIDPQIAPDGTGIDLNICPVSGEEEGGLQIAGTRRITTNVTVSSGCQVITVHRLDAGSGKITLIFITPTLP